MPELSRQPCNNGESLTYTQAVCRYASTHDENDVARTEGIRDYPGSELVSEDDDTGTHPNINNDPLVIPDNTSDGNRLPGEIYETPASFSCSGPLSG